MEGNQLSQNGSGTGGTVQAIVPDISAYKKRIVTRLTAMLRANDLLYETEGSTFHFKSNPEKSLYFDIDEEVLVMSQGSERHMLNCRASPRPFGLQSNKVLASGVKRAVSEGSKLNYCACCASFKPVGVGEICDQCVLQSAMKVAEEAKEKIDFLKERNDVLEFNQQHSTNKVEQLKMDKLKLSSHIRKLQSRRKKGNEASKTLKRENKVLAQELQKSEEKVKELEQEVHCAKEELDAALAKLGDEFIDSRHPESDTSVDVGTELHDLLEANLEKLHQKLEHVLLKIGEGEVNCGIDSKQLRDFCQLAAAQFKYWRVVKQFGNATAMRWPKSVIHYTVMLAERFGINQMDTLKSMVMLPSKATIYSWKNSQETPAVGLHLKELHEITLARKKFDLIHNQGYDENSIEVRDAKLEARDKIIALTMDACEIQNGRFVISKRTGTLMGLVSIDVPSTRNAKIGFGHSENSNKEPRLSHEGLSRLPATHCWAFVATNVFLKFHCIVAHEFIGKQHPSDQIFTLVDDVVFPLQLADWEIAVLIADGEAGTRAMQKSILLKGSISDPFACQYRFLSCSPTVPFISDPVHLLKKWYTNLVSNTRQLRMLYPFKEVWAKADGGPKHNSNKTELLLCESCAREFYEAQCEEVTMTPAEFEDTIRQHECTQCSSTRSQGKGFYVYLELVHISNTILKELYAFASGTNSSSSDPILEVSHLRPDMLNPDSADRMKVGNAKSVLSPKTCIALQAYESKSKEKSVFSSKTNGVCDYIMNTCDFFKVCNSYLPVVNGLESEQVKALERTIQFFDKWKKQKELIATHENNENNENRNDFYITMETDYDMRLTYHGLRLVVERHPGVQLRYFTQQALLLET